MESCRRFKKFLNKYLIDKIIGYVRNVCRLFAGDKEDKDKDLII